MRTLLFAAAIAVASLAACSKAEKTENAEPAVEHDVPEIAVADVAAGIATKQLQVVDCNSEKTRKKMGIIPGAILISDEEKFPASELPTNKSTKLVFYCGGPG